MVWHVYDQNDKIPLLIGKNKKVPGLFKDELGGKIITEFVAFSYLDDVLIIKKLKVQKSV